MINNKLAVAINFGELRGIGPLGLSGGPESAPSIFNQFISGAIGLMTIIALIWFTLNFLIGAMGIMTSGGDKGKLESARGKLTSGIIGVVVIVAAIFVVQLVGSLIGLPDILKPTSFIEALIPKL